MSQGSLDIPVKEKQPTDVDSVDGSDSRVIEIDPEAEKRLRRKLDLRILPIVTICYLFLFLDRGNVGNARSAGLVEDLGLHTYDFNIGTSLFYVCYLLFEIPFALLVKRVGFILVPFSIITFGIITIGAAFIHNRGGFFATRLMLGISEAVTMPGISYLLTRYYRRHELTSRVGCFMLVAAACGGGFGGLLAAGLLSVDRIGSRTSWNNIFLVEGIMTAGWGILMIFLFPTDPEKTKMLTEEERALVIKRMYVDQPSIGTTKEKATKKLIKRGVFSVTTVVCTWICIVDNLSVQGLGIFLPSILKLNYPDASTIHIQLLVVPVYVVAGVVSIMCTIGCVRYRTHWPFCLFGGILTIIGYSIWISTDASFTKARYAACFLNLSGGLINGPVVIGWAAANASPDTLRAMVGAVTTGIGGIGSIAGVWAYVATDAHTGYRKGNSFNLALAASLCVSCIGLLFWQMRENKNRATGGRDYRLKRSKEEVEVLGSLHPKFRLIY
jgi:sugar phosphate permease